MTNKSERTEKRLPLKVRVDLSSVDVRVPAHEGITENVSVHGARVKTSYPFPPNLRVNVRSMLGDLKSRGRIVYCERLGGGAYAIGLELFATAGDWTVPPVSSTVPGQ
jgi:hypothetical protein